MQNNPFRVIQRCYTRGAVHHRSAAARQPDAHASGATAPFFMDQADHYTLERSMQESFTHLLGEALPHVRVLDVELDQPHEVVRLFVDCDGGVSHDMCRDVTRAVRDLCPNYALEVSSPGIEPPLRTIEHLEAAQGSLVRIRIRAARRSFRARLISVSASGITVEREDGTNEEFAHDQVARMHQLEGHSEHSARVGTSDSGVRSQS